MTDRRAPFFDSKVARSLLGNCFRECRQRWPFELDGLVLLPDHLHAIWSLPPGDSAYSTRWSWLKKEFTKRWLAAGAVESEISKSRQSEKRRGVWQPRFWEHTIQDEGDFERHFDDIHYNPVKYGSVKCPHNWPHSSIHRWVRAGVYSWNCACWEDGKTTMKFDDLIETVGE